MKCPSKNRCDNKYTIEKVDKMYPWIKLFGYHIFPKFWQPILRFYCGAHGNFMYIDGEWWWYSYFHPGLPLGEDGIVQCPKKCWRDKYLDIAKEVHRGKDGKYYCSHCSWKGKEIKDLI